MYTAVCKCTCVIYGVIVTRHTPVRPRHDVRSERRMRQVNIAPSDPPVSYTMDL